MLILVPNLIKKLAFTWLAKRLVPKIQKMENKRGEVKATGYAKSSDEKISETANMSKGLSLKMKMRDF